MKTLLIAILLMSQVALAESHDNSQGDDCTGVITIREIR